jgi:hypothetical protein
LDDRLLYILDRLKQKPWVEIFVLYGLILAITMLSGLIDGFLGGIALLLVSLSFIYLPIEYLQYHREPLAAYGLHEGGFGHPQGYWAAIKRAAMIALIVFPLYALAYGALHQIKGQQVHWSIDSLTRWSEDLRDEPIFTDLQAGEVLVYAIQNHLYLHWHFLANDKQIEFKLNGIQKHQIKLLASNQNLKITQNQALDVWIKNIHIFNRSKAKASKGWAYFEYASNAIDLEILIDGKALKESTHQIYTGALRKSASAQIKEQKSFHWIWQIFLIQLFLVAFPEEIFYRGYLQSRLDQMIGKDQKILGVWVNLQSILLCSVLFAIAHLLTIPNLARLSVFFPSLLFGWMRRADRSVVPVAIFHALCNLFSQFLWGFY